MTELETVLESALAPLTEQIRQLSERIAKLEPANVATKDKKEYTTREFAERVGLSPWTVRQKCNKGDIPEARHVPGRGQKGEWLIRHEALTRFCQRVQ